MGHNLKSNLRLKILLHESVPKSKEGYCIAISNPWRFAGYEIERYHDYPDTIDDHIKEGTGYTYAIFDVWRPMINSILARFRCSYPCLVLFKNDEEFREAMASIKPTKPYEWSRFAEYGKGYELNSASDIRYSPLFMKYLNKTIEDWYQLDIKGWKYAGFQNWKDVKGREPLQFEALEENFERTGVGANPDYLYLFTDNLLRTSGRNENDDNCLYNRAFHVKHSRYPNYSQAVIRGLQNACPITTMKDCYKHQLDDLEKACKTWDYEIKYIQRLLQTWKFKGIKFSKTKFGQGTYSRLEPEFQVELDRRLRRIGIFNTDHAGNIHSPSLKEIYRGYFEYNQSLFHELAVIGKRYVFTERFATTDNTQVRYYCELLNEYYGLNSPSAGGETPLGVKGEKR